MVFTSQVMTGFVVLARSFGQWDAGESRMKEKRHISGRTENDCLCYVEERYIQEHRCIRAFVVLKFFMRRC